MPEYGDVLYKAGFPRPWFKRTMRPFRYRMDPVPGTAKKLGYCFRNWYKTGINCLQEKKKYYDSPELVRGKRSPRSLPNDWEDYQRGDVDTRRSWKNKKVKKQWQKNLL